MTIILRYIDTKRKAEIVTKGGVDSMTGVLLFDFYPAEIVSEIKPHDGPGRGGTSISVFGSNFRNTPELAVMFKLSGAVGNTTETPEAIAAVATVAARFVSIGEIVIEAPKCPLGSGVGGSFFVEVTSNGVDFSSSPVGPLYFYHAGEPFVGGVAPTIIREGGNVVLTVFGSDFPEIYFANALVCVFGDSVRAPATRHSEEVLTCTAPPHPPGSVVIAVTYNDQLLTVEQEHSIEYISAFQTLTTWPLLGPASGGTAVTVYGEGFRAEETYICAFGASRPPVHTTFVNASALICHTPPFSDSKGGGKVNLRVSMVQNESSAKNADQGYWIGSPEDPVFVDRAEADNNHSTTSLYFEYHGDVNIHRINPANGPASGGTVVRIYGSGFLDLPGVACRFGIGETTSAQVVNGWTLVCSSSSLASAIGSTTDAEYMTYMERSRAEKTVPVRVTMNGVDFLPRTYAGEFLYDEDINISSLVPNKGPRTGGARVIVYGSGFRDSDDLACRFGLHVVKAEYLRANAIACVAPPQTRLSVVLVSVTLNGQDYTSRQHLSSVTSGDNVAYEQGPLFTYTDRASVTSLTPDQGSTRGGTIVRVSGVNFAKNSTLLCRFGTVVTTVVEFVSTRLVTCVSPAVPVMTGGVQLEVSDDIVLDPSFGSTNPVLWTDSGIIFTFRRDPEVLAIFPASGPSSGGTRVNLTGSGFDDVPSLGCRFGVANDGEGDNDVLSAEYAYVPATYVSSTEVICTTPEHRPGWNLDGFATDRVTVRVAATFNGQDYGLRMAQFTYFPTPKVSPISFSRGPTWALMLRKRLKT